ncbi:MAG: class I SAM-dependent methyltransferase, partial [Bacteroidota bacterium]|nr:class I SAM-dependent methyltransferase [Bacteroidota bacterium]
PDFKKSIKAMVDKLKPGGELIVDFYAINGWWTKIHAKYMFRPFTKKMSHEKLLNVIEKNADTLIGLSSLFTKMGIGGVVNRFLPVCDIEGTMPRNISKEELREWVILDTFDMFSPEHDHPQKISTVKKWFEEFGMEVTFAGKIPYLHCISSVVKGIKK